MGSVNGLPICSRATWKVHTPQDTGLSVARDTETLATVQLPEAVKLLHGSADPTRADERNVKKALGWMRDGIASVGHLDHSMVYTADPTKYQKRF